MSETKLPPIHPGEILLEEFLKPLGLSEDELAHDLHISPSLVNDIIGGTRPITPDTALRLSRYFSLSERFWMNLQARYDLEIEKDRLSDSLENEVCIYAQRKQSGNKPFEFRG